MMMMMMMMIHSIYLFSSLLVYLFVYFFYFNLVHKHTRVNNMKPLKDRFVHMVELELYEKHLK